MSRTLAAFDGMLRKMGDPVRIRVHPDAKAKLRDVAYMMSFEFRPRLTHRESDDVMRFEGIPIDADPSLSPWEIAWDMPRGVTRSCVSLHAL